MSAPFYLSVAVSCVGWGWAAWQWGRAVGERERAYDKLASCVKDGVLQMRDVDRANVYKEHLGEKLKRS